MDAGIRLLGRGAARSSLGRQVRDLGQLHRHAGRWIRGQPDRGFGCPGGCAAGGEDAGGGDRLRLAALGRLSPATRGGSLLGVVGTAGGRTHEAAVLSRTSTGPRCSRTATSRRSRATAGEAPSTSRSTASTPASSLPMGGGHDLMDERSHHGARGVSGVEARNRRTLCARSWSSSGFERYDREWWHYALRDEPYPDTYFDFPIL